MADPAHVTTDQLRAAYDALGLDPELWHDTSSIAIAPDCVTIHRHLPLREDHRPGRAYLGPGGGLAVEISTIRVGEPTERATALDHYDWARAARFAAEHPAPKVPSDLGPGESLTVTLDPHEGYGIPGQPPEGEETVVIQFDNRSGHWIPDRPGTVDVSEHVLEIRRRTEDGDRG